MSTYTILAEPAAAAIEEKNSQFLGFLHPISSRTEAMAQIEHYQLLHTNANHVCWAYVIGNTRQPLTQAFNDDGEPSGTAGKPMLHVLTERELGNCVGVVVRYFGGVKLGAGGLVRAYSAAISLAAKSAQMRVVTPSRELRVSIGFAQEAKLRHVLAQYQGIILTTAYCAEVRMTISLPSTELESFSQQLINETAGAAKIYLDQ